MSTRAVMKRDTHKSHAELLEDAEWHDFSKRIKVLRNWHCEHCESEKDLEVHHLGYRDGAKPWEYSDHEVMVLCGPCHSELHEFADKLWNEVLTCRNMWIIHECENAVRATIEKHLAVVP